MKFIPGSVMQNGKINLALIPVYTCHIRHINIMR